MTFSHLEIFQHLSQSKDDLEFLFKYFLHVTPIANFEDIQRDGLVPRADQHSKAPPEIVCELGAKASERVCLYPLGAVLKPSGTKAPPFMTLAVSVDDLPPRIGLDWSYQHQPIIPVPVFGSTIGHFVICNVAKLGSLISYEKIAPDKLRIFCQGQAPGAPQSWSRLPGLCKDRVADHS